MLAKLVEDGTRNSKKWWTILKSFMGQSVKIEFPPIILENGDIITDDKQKADSFNEFFSRVTFVEDAYDNIPNIEPLLAGNNYMLRNITVTENEVLDQLKILNTSKAYGPDEVSPKLLKEASSSIVPSLTKLFNASLIVGKFPNSWKAANVMPLFKKDNPSTVGNYRPMSLLSTLRYLRKLYLNIFITIY